MGHDFFITASIIVLATVLCTMLASMGNTEGNTDIYVPMVFVLAVLIISRLTDKWLYGVAASVVAVLGVNYAFTYPYMELNFSIAGYPLTFLTMLAVSISTSALTMQLKRQEKAQAEIEKEKMRANLLRAVSHDLRTPLTAIDGSISAVLEDATIPPGKQRELLTEARNESQWLIRMVENLLSITRMGGREARLVKTPEAAEEIIGEVVNKFKKRFPLIKIEVKIPEELLEIPMDAMLIEQVLVNIMENAAIHGQKTERIKISVEKGDKYVIFSVEDDGKGIDNQIFPRLFSGSADISGDIARGDLKWNMGIGLSVCRTIINAHGGEMMAENIRTGGARFIFTLPLGTAGFVKGELL